MTDIDVMEEAKTRVFGEKVQEILAERQEARDAKSGDDLLEEAYGKLSVNEATLKSEIEAYFYGNGRWDQAEVPPPAQSEIDAAEAAANPDAEVSEPEEVSAFSIPEAK